MKYIKYAYNSNLKLNSDIFYRYIVLSSFTVIGIVHYRWM
jgi:hypothetical protein